MRVMCSFLAVALVIGVADGQAWAQRPGQSNGLGLQNRPDIRGSAAATARSQGALRQVGGSLGGRPNGVGGGAAVGAQFGAQSSNRGGQSGVHANVRSGVRGDANLRGMSLHSRARATLTARGQVGGRPDRADAGTPTEAEPDESTGGSRRGAPWNRQEISRAEWLLAKRLASIDHLRDVAMANGNLQMLDQADKLEAEARAQFNRRGETTPTDPETSPDDGTQPTNPDEPADPQPSEPTPIDSEPSGSATVDLIGTIEVDE